MGRFVERGCAAALSFGHRSKRRGISQIEVLIAAALLTTALLGTMRAQVGASKLMRQSKETMAAVQILETAMGEVRQRDSGELNALEAGAENVQGGIGPAIGIADVLQGQDLHCAVIPGTSNVSMVRLTLNWQSDTSGARTLELFHAVRE